jgi:hypothetical protein
LPQQFFFLIINPFLSAAKKAEQNKAKTQAFMGLKTHFARVAINTKGIHKCVFISLLE